MYRRNKIVLSHGQPQQQPELLVDEQDVNKKQKTQDSTTNSSRTTLHNIDCNLQESSTSDQWHVSQQSG